MFSLFIPYLPLACLGFKEFYVCFANSHAAFTPQISTGYFSVRLNRFTLIGRWEDSLSYTNEVIIR